MAIRTSASTGRLGTFAGVFTPSVLTILGIVLFLRLGYVVGSVGLERALLIIAAAHFISIVTSLSVAAIATNLRVRGGGDYYLISRTLGLDFGAAIGCVLFVAQAVAVGFYCVGFAEAVAAVLDAARDGIGTRLIGVAAVVGLFGLAWQGADLATRFQYVVMAALFAAIASFFAGSTEAFGLDHLSANLAAPGAALPFWAAFAVFFPAVTGFTQGISMSGELRDPGRSIPLGTLAAVLVALVVYIGAAVLLAGAEPAAELARDGLAMKRLSALPLLFTLGVIAATLSSALASFLGAPRILQAMAKDDILPGIGFFAKGEGAQENPRRAVVLTGAIAVLVAASGQLDAIAAVVSMCFLLSYALLNYATYFEAHAASPSFRPRFRFFDQRLSLVGALACLVAMVAIDVTSALVASLLVLAAFYYLRRRGLPASWADSRRSHHLQAVRDHLLAAAAEPAHPRNWRPQILVFSDSPLRRARLLQFAGWVGGGVSMTSVVRILERQGADALEERARVMAALQEELEQLQSSAFPLVVTAPRLDPAISTVIQAAGIGPARANTVLVNWMRDPDAGHPFATGRFSQNLRTAFRLGCNLLLLDADDDLWEALDGMPPGKRRIDIWWVRDVSGELMLVLAYLMMRSREWEEATLRVIATPSTRRSASELQRELEGTLEVARIDGEVLVVAEDSVEALVRASADASLVFVPFNLQGGRFVHTHGGEIAPLLDRLPIVVLTMAAEDVDLSSDPDVPADVPAGAGGTNPGHELPG